MTERDKVAKLYLVKNVLKVLFYVTQNLRFADGYQRNKWLHFKLWFKKKKTHIQTKNPTKNRISPRLSLSFQRKSSPPNGMLTLFHHILQICFINAQ